jgi:DNA-binding CsgD family transcriptional regulator
LGVRDLLREYIGANGLYEFQLHLDVLRSLVDLEQDAYALDVERLELTIRDRLDLGDYAESSGEHLGAIVNAWTAVRQQCPVGSLFGDLLTVATPPASYEAADSRLSDLADWMSRRLDYAESRQEIVRALRPVRISLVSDEKRIAAAERVAEFLGHVIHKSRWRSVKACLDKLAHGHGQTVDAELRRLIVARLFEIVDLAGKYSLTDEEGVRRELRKRLNRLVTADVLGTDWRRLAVTEQITDTHGPSTPPPEAQIEARLTIEQRMAAAGLTRREAEVVAHVALYEREHGALEAAARALGMAPATARVHWHNANKKLHRAAGQD